MGARPLKGEGRAKSLGISPRGGGNPWGGEIHATPVMVIKTLVTVTVIDNDDNNGEGTGNGDDDVSDGDGDR